MCKIVGSAARASPKAVAANSTAAKWENFMTLSFGRALRRPVSSVREAGLTRRPTEALEGAERLGRTADRAWSGHGILHCETTRPSRGALAFGDAVQAAS